MSPVAFNAFRHTRSNQDLNGPVLSYILEPQDLSIGKTTATFIGIATAGFTTTTAKNDGYVKYQWYEVGVGALSDNDNITGSGTSTLSINNISDPETDTGREFYVEATYSPTLNTGKAINEPLISSVASLGVLPEIEIIAQPTDVTTNPNTVVSFTIDPRLTDGSPDSDISYQWTINGSNVSDGQNTVEYLSGEINETFSSDTTITIPENATDIIITVAGGQGGRGASSSGSIGGDGSDGTLGRFIYYAGATLDLKVGRTGNDGRTGSGSGTGGDPGLSEVAKGGTGGNATSRSGGGGGGGGASGVYDVGLGRYTIVAAGGGGGGGASGNTNGTDGLSAVLFEFTQSDINVSEGNNGVSGSGGGGAGGGGALGGAGGDQRIGGIAGQSEYNIDYSEITEQRSNPGDGFVNVSYKVPTSSGSPKRLTYTVSGATSQTMSASVDSVGVSSVGCVLSHPTATNSPVTSDSVIYSSISNDTQYPLSIEQYGNSTEVVSRTNIDLFNGEYEISNSDLVDFSYFCLFAPSKELNIEMDLYGGKGSDFGSKTGGEGGFSRIRFTIPQNEEYIISGLDSLINTPFLYRKASLIACVGSGGDAGFDSDGGFGGGIGVAGGAGDGRRGGAGGETVQDGTLPFNGIYGSRFTTAVPVSPDTLAVEPSGGRTLPCPPGVNFRDQGLAPCADINSGQFSRFVLPDGTTLNESSSISRGFKSGYSINETAGLGGADGGNGGNGATGGDGGISGSGGGGGSGYTDGSVNVISSILGGSNSDSKVVIRIVS